MAAARLALLGMASSPSSVSAGLPVFPTEYSAVIQVNMPYIPMTQPIRLLTSSKAQKTEFYDGLETDVSNAKGTYKFAFNNSKRVCMFSPPSSGPTAGLKLADWKPKDFFPDLSTYKQEADELVGGIMCQKFTFSAPHGKTMDDHFSFYWDAVLSKPVRWHQHARALPFGSHTDEYIIDYVSFQAEAPNAKDLELDPMCAHPVTVDIALRAEGLLASMHGKAHSKSDGFFLRFRKGKAKGSSKDRRTAEHQKYVHEHVPSGAALPENFDWRTARPGVIGPVKDQAMCGSCWAYGAVGPVESAVAIATGQRTELPEQFVVDCAWTSGTGASGKNSGCDGGDSDIGILEIVRKYGGIIPTAASYGSYLSTNGYCKDIRLMEVGAKVSGWADIKKNDVEGFKDALVHKGAISIGIMVPDAMLYFDSGVLDSAECKCDEAQIDHAVEAVGYGVSEDGKAYWTVRNSWSTYWGDEGYIKVVQGPNDCCVAAQAGYAVVEGHSAIVPEQEVVMPKPALDCSHCYYDGKDHTNCNPSSFPNDPRCVCGPAGSDWRPASDCGGAKPKPVLDCSHCHYDGKDHTNCNPSSFPNDPRCVCGPASSDWRPASDCGGEAKQELVIV